MRTWSAVVILAGVMCAGSAQLTYAQATDVPRVEIGILPAGATFFTSGDSGAPSFGTYALAGSVTVNINRFVGVEGEVGGNLGIEQDLEFTTGTQSMKPPHILSYTGSVVVSPGGRDRRVAPYIAGGIGGLTLFERAEVGVPENTTLFAGNVGGGVKIDVSDRWGFRADYRFIPVASKDDAPAFFGRDETRYGHRIAGGILINLAR
jgi:opacity protein-like surface antigen